MEMDFDALLRERLLGGNVERGIMPSITPEFMEKQSAISASEEGRALLMDINAYRMSVLDCIAFSTEGGRKKLREYMAGVESLYTRQAQERAARAEADRDAKMLEMENELAELRKLKESLGG